jgi:hypothetical protein
MKEIRLKDFDLEVQTPPGTKVSIPLASQSGSNAVQSDYHFRLPMRLKKVRMNVEGPFGGQLIREVNLDEMSGPLKISEKRIESSSTEPDPTGLDSSPASALPHPSGRVASQEILPGVDRNQILPQNAVYDGTQDLFSTAAKGRVNLLELQSAALSFDSEDGSVLIGFDPKTGQAAFENGGGFYSNLHYVVLPYTQGLEAFYRQMEKDFTSLLKLEKELRENSLSSSEKTEVIEKMRPLYTALYGKEKEEGPYQLLMHYAFNTLKLIGREDLTKIWGSPLAHGFIPGPFLGSRHWGYSLCEWGDTARHAPLQKMKYDHFGLWNWPSEGSGEKLFCS